MSFERLIVLSMMIINGVGLHLLERGAGGSVTDEVARRRHIGPNLVLTGLLLGVNVALDRLAAAAGAGGGGGTSGLAGLSSLPPWAEVLVVVVGLDGVTYLAHVLMHKLPAAWRFHRVHHSDAHVDVTTAFRQHPLESVWRHAFLGAGALGLGAGPVA